MSLQDSLEPMSVDVFASLKRADTYLYVPETANVDALDAQLLSVFGPRRWVMQIDVDVDRQLARLTGRVLLGALYERGYYLQLPPPQL